MNRFHVVILSEDHADVRDYESDYVEGSMPIADAHLRAQELECECPSGRVPAPLEDYPLSEWLQTLWVPSEQCS